MKTPDSSFLLFIPLSSSLRLSSRSPIQACHRSYELVAAPLLILAVERWYASFFLVLFYSFSHRPPPPFTDVGIIMRNIIVLYQLIIFFSFIK